MARAACSRCVDGGGLVDFRRRGNGGLRLSQCSLKAGLRGSRGWLDGGGRCFHFHWFEALKRSPERQRRPPQSRTKRPGQCQVPWMLGLWRPQWQRFWTWEGKLISLHYRISTDQLLQWIQNVIRWLHAVDPVMQPHHGQTMDQTKGNAKQQGRCGHQHNTQLILRFTVAVG